LKSPLEIIIKKMHKYRLSVHGSNVLAVIMTLYMFHYFNRIYNKILDRD